MRVPLFVAYLPFFSSFLFESSAPHRDLHSFPTRRSSDLGGVGVGPAIQDHRQGEVEVCDGARRGLVRVVGFQVDRKSTRLNSSHRCISYAVFCLKKKKKTRSTVQ